MKLLPAWVLAMLVGLSPAARADLVRVAQVTAPRSASEIEVPVSLENLDTVGGFKLTVTYDQSRLEPQSPLPGARTQAFEIFESNIEQPGIVVVVGIADFLGGSTSPPLAAGEGEIVVLRFAPLEGAAAGRAPLQLVGDPSATSTSNTSGTTLGLPDLEHGWIQLTGDVPGMSLSWGGVKRAFSVDAPPAR